ncbi:MAG: AgmX/PglI C-terminal domain-containing protein [Bdellovibrionales bacterium]
MGCRELFIEHKYKGRFLKGIRLHTNRKKLLIGSGRGSQLRLHGTEISGIHALIEHTSEGWKIYDLGSAHGTKINGENITDFSCNKEVQVQLGEHILRLVPREEVVKLYSHAPMTRGATNSQEVVLIYHGRVTQTFSLAPHEKFQHTLNGEVIELQPAKNSEWTITKYGAFEVHQRLMQLPEPIQKDKVEFDRELGRAFIPVAGFMFFLFALGFLITPKEKDKPVPSKMTQMIYDAKVMQKKRENAQMVKTRMAGTNSTVSEAMKPTAGARVGKVTVATKAISNIKASGLSSLIGKIALRAGNTSALVASSGSTNSDAPARGVVTGSTMKGQFENSQGTGFKISNVATGGKAGGAKGYATGAELAVGSVGSGEVGMLEEESIVDGGLDREVIAAVIKESLGEIRYCYERHLSANPNLMGKVQVKFTIGSIGSVTEQSIGTTTLNNAMVEGCILRRVARWKFPTPKGGTSVMVTYPFLFKSLN